MKGITEHKVSCVKQSTISKMGRSSNIELLRIVAMFLIVQSHFAVHGYMSDINGALCSIDNSLNRFLVTAMTTGNIGNGIFMLITGYFMSKKTRYSVRRILNVVFQVLTYSIFCYLGYMFYEAKYQFSIKDLIVAITPFLHSTYWYFTSYILILFFHPFINILVEQLHHKRLGSLICIMSFIWGIVPSVTGISYQGSSFLVFCTFYLIGAYIRKYYVESDINSMQIFSKRNVKLWTLFLIIIWIVLSLITSRYTPFYRIVYMGSPFMFLLSIFLFLLFLNINVKNSIFINTVATGIGGVYLLSDNPYVRSVIYRDLFHVGNLLESNSMFLYTLFYSLITFFVCLLVEIVRGRVYNWIESKVLRESAI